MASIMRRKDGLRRKLDASSFPGLLNTESIFRSGQVKVNLPGPLMAQDYRAGLSWSGPGYMVSIIVTQVPGWGRDGHLFYFCFCCCGKHSCGEWGQGRGGSVYLAYNSRSEFTVVRKSRNNVNKLIALHPGTQREGRRLYSAGLPHLHSPESAA